jgi:hypothetical protein
MPTLLGELDKQSSQIRFEVIDFSAGELIRLHDEKEILIQPHHEPGSLAHSIRRCGRAAAVSYNGAEPMTEKYEIWMQEVGVLCFKIQWKEREV